MLLSRLRTRATVAAKAAAWAVGARALRPLSTLSTADAVALYDAGKEIVGSDRREGTRLIEQAATDGNLPQAQHALGFLCLHEPVAPEKEEKPAPANQAEARQAVLDELKGMKKKARSEMKQRRRRNIEVVHAKASELVNPEEEKKTRAQSKWDSAQSWFLRAAEQGFADSQVGWETVAL